MSLSDLLNTLDHDLPPNFNFSLNSPAYNLNPAFVEFVSISFYVTIYFTFMHGFQVGVDG